MSMHNYQENGDELDDFEEEEEYEDEDESQELLSVPPEPPTPTTVVLKPNSLEALIGSGFKAGTSYFLPQTPFTTNFLLSVG